MNHRIKQISTTITLLALCFASSSSRQTRANQTNEIILAEGTAINVVTAQEITSKEAKPNDPVNFTVAEDLVINGQVVVRKGTDRKSTRLNSSHG